MTSYLRFHAWYYTRESKLPNPERDAIDAAAWTAWQAAETATARRCVQIADQIGTHDGDVMVHSISAEYPEAFK